MSGYLDPFRYLCTRVRQYGNTRRVQCIGARTCACRFGVRLSLLGLLATTQFLGCIRLIRGGDPATSSVELGTLRRTQHSWSCDTGLPSTIDCHRSMRRRRCTRCSSMAYQIGQPDRFSTNIFAVSSEGIGGHKVECVAALRGTKGNSKTNMYHAS